jgi:polynucleotide 5'-hydroxyl-kinase GRC3/NOL9
MEAVLPQGKGIYEVYAPVSQAVPGIVCLTDSSTIILRNTTQGPNLGNIYNKFHSVKGGNRTFTPILNQKDLYNLEKHGFSMLASKETGWDYVLSSLRKKTADAAIQSIRAPVIMVTGPKATGKSTMTRLLANSILTNPVTTGPASAVKPVKASTRSKKARNVKSVPNEIAILDLDPGQAEFTAPGSISLVLVRQPLMGPSYTHPADYGHHHLELVRSHHIGFLSPKEDPYHYRACVEDLAATYQRHIRKNPRCTLIINTSGWIKGLGLDLLKKFGKVLDITDLVAFELGRESDKDSYHHSEELDPKIEKRILLACANEKDLKVTPAESRTMQIVSYMHHGFLSPDAKMASWHRTPLAAMRPWEVPYAGAEPGIQGIAILGGDVEPIYLATAINATLLSIVVVEDEDLLSNATLTRTPAEDLPYLQCVTTIFNGSPGAWFDPSRCYCAGLALLRAIDVEEKCLQLLTPVPQWVMAGWSGKKVVLVRGRLELPVEEMVAGLEGEKTPYIQ